MLFVISFVSCAIGFNLHWPVRAGTLLRSSARERALSVSMKTIYEIPLSEWQISSIERLDIGF